MPSLIQIATACGGLPLVTGTAIYFTWRLTRWDWLMGAGLLTIAAGCLAIIVGLAVLMEHTSRALRASKTSRVSIWLQVALVVGLFLINFPIAAFYAISANGIVMGYVVNAENRSDQLVESLIVIGPGVNEELGPIPPGESRYRRMHFQRDGALRFTVRQQQQEFGGQLEDYVTHGSSDEKTIRIEKLGKFEIVRAVTVD